jgi:hypothetical protein|tara:strand:+ start:260 stop:520 length:261 start_codon:yes stop_codon:yes gene_type:complete
MPAKIISHQLVKLFTCDEVGCVESLRVEAESEARANLMALEEGWGNVQLTFARGMSIVNPEPQWWCSAHAAGAVAEHEKAHPGKRV